MRIAVTGSIATDHLMVFPGSFTEQLVGDQLDKVSLSFLADELQIRRGGTAANIAVGLGRLGMAPSVVGAVGADFADYRQWLHANRVSTDLVLESRTLHTARFVCTTDRDQNQIATFYAGAMSVARDIDLEPAIRAGGMDLVLIAPDDPAAMIRHTETCRRLSVPFAADPSQQLARLDAESARRLVDGARYLFTNEYESALLLRLTGWSQAELRQRVGVWITTLGADGVRIGTGTDSELLVPAVPTTNVVDPTGVGDAFRAGFLAGVAWQWPHGQAARLGCAMSTVVLESAGSQEYKLSAADLLLRIDDAYGADTARSMSARLYEAVI